MACDEPANFNEAKAYNCSSSSEKERGAKIIDLLQLEEGSKVLDLGCGTGYLTQLLASRVGPMGQVMGIDPNPKRLAIAKEKYPAPNVVYQEGQAEDISGSDYDAVFANYVLHWCKDKDRVFKQVAKSLKKGGKFGYVTLCDTDLTKKLLKVMLTAEGLQIVESTTHPPSSEDLHKLALDNGFKNVYTNELVRAITFKDLPSVIEFYRTHYPLGEEHFNLEAMRKYHEKDQITLNEFLKMDILQKV